MRGRHVLYTLRDLEKGRTATSPLSGIPAGEIARHSGRGKDGRAVTATLQRLEDVGLVRRVYHTLPRWATTERGKEVERLCSAGDASRGGRFKPLVDFLGDLHERLAMHG